MNGDMIICIEDHKYQPHNFWNGRWRSQWTVSSNGDVVGKFWVHVHYYEDGNVQLVSNKEVKDKVSLDDTSAAVEKLFKIVLAAENEYQVIFPCAVARNVISF